MSELLSSPLALLIDLQLNRAFHEDRQPGAKVEGHSVGKASLLAVYSEQLEQGLTESLARAGQEGQDPALVF